MYVLGAITVIISHFFAVFFANRASLSRHPARGGASIQVPVFRKEMPDRRN
jgi:hypothetical protein